MESPRFIAPVQSAALFQSCILIDGPRFGTIALLLACCLAALLAGRPAAAQPPGSNPGLPPSATATGLAPQMITDMAGEGSEGGISASGVKRGS